jgi:WD40 repeat protein
MKREVLVLWVAVCCGCGQPGTGPAGVNSPGGTPPERPLAPAGALLSPDNNLVLVFFYALDGVKFWDIQRGEERRIPTPPVVFKAAAFLPDGGAVLSAKEPKVPLQLWDVTSGQVLRTFPDEDADAYTNGVIRLAVSPDGRLALSAHSDLRLKLWDVGSGKKLRVMGESQQYSTATFITYLAFLPDGKRAMASYGGCNLQVWDVTTGERGKPLAGCPGLQVLAVSADGTTALYSRTGGSLAEPFPVVLWDLTAEKEVRRFLGHKRFVSGAAFGPGEGQVLSGSEDGVLKCWDVDRAREVWSYESGHGGAHYAFSADRRLALAVSSDGTMELVDALQGKRLRQLTGPASASRFKY